MFKLFGNKEVKKYKNIYELAKENCKEFEKNNNYSKYTKQTIKIIEQDIARLSKKGVRRLEYNKQDFNAHTDMTQVRKYFESQGFEIYEFADFYFNFFFFTSRCLTVDIRW